METKATQIKKILSTQLLAPSHSDLAKTLGYRGRTSLYRLADGTALDNAIESFCARLEDVFYIDADILNKICVTIDDTDSFSHIMRRCSDSSVAQWPFEVLKAFVTNDYSMMHQGFVENELCDIMAIERADSDRFYNMLAYFYIRSMHIQFYKKGKSHSERCASVLEPLGYRFIDIFPENAMAAEFVKIYSDSNLLKYEAPVLMSLVGSISTMLHMFRNPQYAQKPENDAILLQGIRGRTYWECSGTDGLILLKMVAENDTSGYYEMFIVSLGREQIENICNIVFLTESVMLIKSKESGESTLGRYSWDGENIIFEWEEGRCNPVGLGDAWHKIEFKTSRSLRELNHSISDDKLNRCVLMADGWEELAGYGIRDVVVSCKKYSLVLQSGTTYSIPLEKARFLEHILPSEPVKIYRRRSDGRLMVLWPNLRQVLPLEVFV